MNRKEKHVSVLHMYLAKLEKRYENTFEGLGEFADEARFRELIDLYRKIENTKKEIEEFKR